MYADIFYSTLIRKDSNKVVRVEDGEIIGQAFVMLKSGELDAADGKEKGIFLAFASGMPGGIGALALT